MAPRAWRLILHAAPNATSLATAAATSSGPGAWNMGVDEALLASAAAGGPPTLRLYEWSAPTLSLGYAQSAEPSRLAACAEAGLDVVRRATGGRAVLHGGDLTYAVAAPDDALPPGLRGSYALVCEALQAALRSLGIEVERTCGAAGPPRRKQPGFDCFAEPAADELCAGGRKLVGSAQRRVAGAVLQHGSIRLRPEPPDVQRAAGLVPGVATSLEELGHPGGAETLRAACVAAFRAALDAPLEPGALTPAEARLAALRKPFHPAAIRGIPPE